MRARDDNHAGSHGVARARSLLKLAVRCGFLLTPLLAYGDSDRLMSVPLPPDVERQSVALDVVQRGHRVSIATLQNAYPVKSVIDFYRDQWQTTASSMPGFIENQAGDWHIISRVEDGWNTVVQLRKTNSGSEAYLSVMELVPVEGWAYNGTLPSGGVLVSSTVGNEFGKPTQTDVIFSKAREGEVAGFYRRQFEDKGWTVVHDNDIQGSTTLLMQRTGAQAEVVVTPAQNGSVAVVNQVGGDE